MAGKILVVRSATTVAAERRIVMIHLAQRSGFSILFAEVPLQSFFLRL
ncbi:hypothetical protein ACRQ5Q_21540 [Bradyrhizobium sp. PMVTL-01]